VKYEAPFWHILWSPSVVTRRGSQSIKAQFQGFGDRDLVIPDAASPDSQNEKLQKHFMDKCVVTAIGHIDGRWRKKLEVLSFTTGMLKCRNVKW
jgi:hypothetical protein